MLSFATEFPVSGERTSADFASSFFQWILDSPHTSFTEQQLRTNQQLTDHDYRSGTEIIRMRTAHSDFDELVGFEHSILDRDISWTTTCVFSKSIISSWVSVRTSRETEQPTVQLPPAKKPVLVRTLINRLSGGKDGLLVVQSVPLRLQESQVDLASNLILDSAEVRLPVVYVSIPFTGRHIVDLNGLASDLAGMAHVIVEPSRDFSRNLQETAYSENVYGGVVGVYWPESSGKRTFYLPSDFQNAKAMKWAIADDVRLALLNRRPLYRASCDLLPVFRPLIS